MIDMLRGTFSIIKDLFLGMKEYFFLKILPSFVIPAFVFLFGADGLSIVYGLLVLIVIDFITGICSAKKMGVPIESRIAVKSAYKVAVYAMLMSSGHITEQIIPGTTFIEQAVTTFLAITELISIIENAGKMGFAVPQRLLNQLQDWRDGSERRSGLATRREDEIVIPK